MSICLKLGSNCPPPCRWTRPTISFLEQSLAPMSLQNNWCLEMVTGLGRAAVGVGLMPNPGSWIGWSVLANSCSLGGNCQEFHADRGYKQQILGPTHTEVHSIIVHISTDSFINLSFIASQQDQRWVSTRASRDTDISSRLHSNNSRELH